MQYLSSLNRRSAPWSTRGTCATAIVALFALTACGGSCGGGNGSLPDTSGNGVDADTGGTDYDTYLPPEDGGDTADEDPTDSGQQGDGDAADAGGEADGGGGTCNLGSSRCTDDGKSQTCVPGPNGGRWGEPSSCGPDEFCDDTDGLCDEKSDVPCRFQDKCSANANCSKDADSDQGFVCECFGKYIDYKGDGSICIPNYFTTVESGNFQMGSPRGETGRDNDERRHQVTIDHALAVQKYEVTQATWGEFEQNGKPWKDVSSCNQTVCPVFNVNWWDALHFANAMSKDHDLETCYDLTDCSGTPGEDFSCSSVTFKGVSCKGWRLPTEAEWEYVARAGTSTATFKGDLSDPTTDSNVGAIAWYRSNSKTAGTNERQPHVWGGKEANSWELRDTSGNVAEWVWDWYGSYPSGSKTNPTGPSSGSKRVVRGGHWNSPASACRSADRTKSSPDTRNNKIGFRVVRTLPPK